MTKDTQKTIESIRTVIKEINGDLAELGTPETNPSQEAARWRKLYWADRSRLEDVISTLQRLSDKDRPSLRNYRA